MRKIRILFMSLMIIGTLGIKDAKAYDDNAMIVADDVVYKKGDTSNVITRKNFADILVGLTNDSYKAKLLKNNKIFKDVKKDRGNINLAVINGYMSSYTNDRFMPNKPLTMNQAIYSVMKLLGYQQDDDYNKIFYDSDLDRGISKRGNQSLTILDVKKLIANLLQANTKDNQKFASKIGIDLNDTGKIDIDSYVNKSKNVFLVNSAFRAWLSGRDISIKKDNKAVMKNSLGEYDLAYLDKRRNQLSVYTNKIYGQIDEILPNRNNPKSIKLGDKTYNFASNVVNFYKAKGYATFSDLMQARDISEGSFIMAILNNNNEIVNIFQLKDTSNFIVGYVLDNSNKLIEGAKGFTLGNALSVVTTSGVKLDVPALSNTVGVGNVVRISFNEDNAPIIRAITDTNRLTQDDLKDVNINTRILEVASGSYSVVSYGDFKNADISKLQVAYVGRDSNGRITDIIIRNGLGNAYKYGIINSVVDSDVNYNIEGNISTGELKLQNDGRLSTGPRAFSFSNGKLVDVRRLNEYKVSLIKDNRAYCNGKVLLMANKVPVYYKVSNEYRYTDNVNLKDIGSHDVRAYTVDASNVVKMLVVNN